MRADSGLVHRILPSPNLNDRRGRAIDALILHYTGMDSGAAALARLRDPAAEVSCHYLVWEDGRIDQLVAEADRAWHAGRAYWAGETDINAVSIGIEIVNAGHPGGCPPYPAAQIDSVVALCADICRRHAIPPARVLAHSDIAPDRKLDPGEHFPWATLAKAGVGLSVQPAPLNDDPGLRAGDEGAPVGLLQARLAALGYDCPSSRSVDAVTRVAVTSFQRRWRPARVDGIADASTMRTLEAVLAAREGTCGGCGQGREIRPMLE